MKEFLMKWTYKKEIMADVLGYGLIGIVGNLLLNRSKDNQDRLEIPCTQPVEWVRNLPPKQKVFNGIVLGTFIVDTTVSLLFLKYLRHKIR